MNASRTWLRKPRKPMKRSSIGHHDPAVPQSKPEGLCAYCGIKRAKNWDHVVPYSLVRKWRSGSAGRCPCPLHDIPDEFLGVVGTCFDCNTLKGQRRLIPKSWAHKRDSMNEFFGGVEWRVWNGDPADQAYAKAWSK